MVLAADDLARDQETLGARQDIDGGQVMALVVISYAHRDEAWMHRVLAHLHNYRDLGIEVWHDRRIASGDEWDEEIMVALDRCDCALLLVSPHFLNSRYITEKELPRIEARYRAKRGIRVIPVPVSPCGVQHHHFIWGLQPWPRDWRELTALEAESRHAIEAALAALAKDVCVQMEQNQQLGWPAALRDELREAISADGIDADAVAASYAWCVAHQSGHTLPELETLNGATAIIDTLLHPKAFYLASDRLQLPPVRNCASIRDAEGWWGEVPSLAT